jgi:GntR family transcriptional repressor for pyruvate dehydrogenase complex
VTTKPRKPRAETPARTSGSSALTVKRIRPAYEQVADQLRELVLSGRVSPGDRLPIEGDLSAEFGVSRSTIREAIRLLSSQSLVHTLRGPAGGTFVSAADTASLRDYLETSIGLLSSDDNITVAHLLEVRESLEIPAARLSAARRTDEDLALLHEAVEGERGQAGRGQRFAQNQQFHVRLLAASKNPLLAAVAEPVFRVIQARFLKEEGDLFFDQVHDEHALLLGYIERGDEEGAAQAMKAHLAALRGVYGQPPA